MVSNKTVGNILGVGIGSGLSIAGVTAIQEINKYIENPTTTYTMYIAYGIGSVLLCLCLSNAIKKYLDKIDREQAPLPEGEYLLLRVINSPEKKFSDFPSAA